MVEKHITRGELLGKTIDSHSHIGVALKMYAAVEYPYAETAEGISYKQRSAGVDVNVVFPFSFELYCDSHALANGVVKSADDPLSDVPYKVENLVMFREIFDFRPYLAERFIPFVGVDPGRAVDEQITELRKLEERYPIYGIKINPVAVQSKATALLDAGKPFLDFAVDRNIPFVFHSTTVPNDIYSQASDILRIAETRTDLRFCLAHALIFNKRALDIAHELENVWVDTAALKIQVDVVNQLVEEGVLSSNDLLDADFSDHRLVMKTLCEKYPDTILWGSDSPAYSFHCVRAQGDGNIQNFAFLGKYEDEIAAINALAPDAQERVSNINTLNFLFGRE